jgi:HD-GYP domain-containing protein (c-di-GMP phosphodiesterase class II)
VSGCSNKVRFVNASIPKFPDDLRRLKSWLTAWSGFWLLAGSGLLAAWLQPLWTLGLTSTALLTLGVRQTLLDRTRIRLLHETVQRQQSLLADQAERHQCEVACMQQALMFGLAHMAEARDPATGKHLRRMKHLARELAQTLQSIPKYQNIVTPEFVKHIEISAMLHDIGKVGIPDSILLKPGKLTPDERREMEQHPLISSECLRRIEDKLGKPEFLKMAHEIALNHHERWDGRGYPFGRRGEEIPLSARIVSVADVYDALVSERVYKPAFPHEQCVAIIRKGAGTQFDPELVEVFLQIEKRFQDVSRRVCEDDPLLSMCSFMFPSHRSKLAEAAVEQRFQTLDDLLSAVDLETSPRRDYVGANSSSSR